MVLVVKNTPANAGDVRDAGGIPGSGRSPGGGHGDSLPYSCLENPMNRVAWQATVHRVIELDTTEATEHTHTLGLTVALETFDLPCRVQTLNRGGWSLLL